MEVSGKKLKANVHDATFCQPCSCDGKTLPAEAYCTVCHEFMCSSCSNVHKNLKMTRSHALLDKRSMPTSRKVMADVSQSTEPCDIHPEELIKYFCQTHQTLSCGHCLAKEHKTCDVDIISEISMCYQDSKEYEYISKAFSELSKALGYCVDDVDTNLKSIKELAENEVSILRQYRDKINTYFDKRENALFKIIEQNKSKDETRLNSIKPKCDDLRAKVEEIKSKLAEQEGNTTQLFIEVQRAKKQIETLQFGMVDINKEMAVHRYQMLIDPATERLLSSSTGLGTVIEMSSSKESTLNSNHLVEPDSEKQIPGVTTKVINQDGVVSFQDDGSSRKLTEEESQDSDNSAKAEEQNCCPICMDNICDPKKLICGHVFCTKCIDMFLEVGKKVCPICFTVVGEITGDQPSGTMTVYSTCDPQQRQLIINYNIPNGRQKSHHPSPGQPFRGTKRTAYLPDNEKGRTICRMLKVAFRRKLVFTIGQTRNTGREVITWNDIHHKTDHGPFTLCGYTDPSYLERITGELKAKGITEEDIDSREPIDGTIYAY